MHQASEVALSRLRSPKEEIGIKGL